MCIFYVLNKRGVTSESGYNLNLGDISQVMTLEEFMEPNNSISFDWLFGVEWAWYFENLWLDLIIWSFLFNLDKDFREWKTLMSNFYFIKDDSCIFFLMGITCYKNDSLNEEKKLRNPCILWFQAIDKRRTSNLKDTLSSLCLNFIFTVFDSIIYHLLKE